MAVNNERDTLIYETFKRLKQETDIPNPEIHEKIAFDFNLSPSRVRHIISAQSRPSDKRGIEDKIIELELEINRLKGQTFEDSFTPPRTKEFPDKVIPEPRTYEAITTQIKAVQKFKERHGISQKEATWQPKSTYSTLPVAVTFFCDVHLGSNEVDYDLLDTHLKIMEETPNMYGIFGGDYADGYNAVKHAVALFGQAVTPEEQWFAWSDRCRRLDRKRKIVAKSWGNHDLFTEVSGINPFSTFLRTASFPLFLQGGGVVNALIGEQKYRLGVKHTYWGNSRLNLTNAAKRAMTYWQPDLDVMMLGHVHTASGETFVQAGEEKVAIAGGTYKLRDTFYMQWTDDPHPAGFTILLYPDFKHVQLCRYPEEAQDIILGKIARLPRQKKSTLMSLEQDVA